MFFRKGVLKICSKCTGEHPSASEHLNSFSRLNVKIASNERRELQLHPASLGIGWCGTVHRMTGELGRVGGQVGCGCHSIVDKINIRYAYT